MRNDSYIRLNYTEFKFFMAEVAHNAWSVLHFLLNNNGFSDIINLNNWQFSSG